MTSRFNILGVKIFGASANSAGPLISYADIVYIVTLSLRRCIKSVQIQLITSEIMSRTRAPAPLENNFCLSKQLKKPKPRLKLRYVAQHKVTDGLVSYAK